MATTVHSYKHKPLPAGSIYVGRANKYGCAGTFGNNHTRGPCAYCSRKHKISVEHTDAECMAEFRSDFFGQLVESSEFRRMVVKLRGKPLVCGCVKRDGSGECHAKAIAEFVDSLPEIASEEEVIEAAKAIRIPVVVRPLTNFERGMKGEETW